jgi:hypothetical protein
MGTTLTLKTGDMTCRASSKWMVVFTVGKVAGALAGLMTFFSTMATILLL